MGFEVASVSPERVTLFGDFTVPVTMVTLWVISGVILVLALVFRFVIFPRFREKPKGLQNILELGIEMANKLSTSQLGQKGKTIAAYVTTLAVVLLLTGLVELVGVRAPATDLNFTSALAIISFVLINAYAFRYRGFGGRMKWFARPIKVIAPIKVLTQVATPISLACRMFGNLFSGLIIMELIYFAMGNFAVAIPGILSAYFNLFHVGMQAYVFIVLTLSFINEGLED